METVPTVFTCTYLLHVERCLDVRLLLPYVGLEGLGVYRLSDGPRHGLVLRPLLEYVYVKERESRCMTRNGYRPHLRRWLCVTGTCAYK